MAEGRRTGGPEHVQKTEGHVRRRLIISGKVQGVFFRESMRKEAERIGGLSGWVRNLDDGSVEAEIQGPSSKVGELVGFGHRGPGSAQVEDVEIEPLECTTDKVPFHIRR